MSVQNKNKEERNNKLTVLYKRFDPSTLQSVVKTAFVLIEEEESGVLNESSMQILDWWDSGGFWLSNSVFIPYHNIVEIRNENVTSKPDDKKTSSRRHNRGRKNIVKNFHPKNNSVPVVSKTPENDLISSKGDNSDKSSDILEKK